MHSMPGEPLPDEYDLLIYAKNGHRPQLLEHLAESFPSHILIDRGKHRRERESRHPPTVANPLKTGE